MQEEKYSTECHRLKGEPDGRRKTRHRIDEYAVGAVFESIFLDSAGKKSSSDFCIQCMKVQQVQSIGKLTWLIV